MEDCMHRFGLSNYTAQFENVSDIKPSLIYFQLINLKNHY